jgi:hypothetical protein
VIKFPLKNRPVQGEGTSEEDYTEIEGGVTNSGSITDPADPPFLPLWHINLQAQNNYTTIFTDVDLTHTEHMEYEQAADTTMTLKTGGKANSTRQNLFCISGSAAEVLDKHGVAMPGDGGFYIGGSGSGGPSPTQPIPMQDVTIDGMPLGSDGNQWRLYADNTTNNVTPRVKKKDFYTFNVGAQKYKLYINLQTSTTNANLDTDTPEVCVGQKVTFAGAWDSDPGAASTSYSWALAGTFVNRSTQANSYSSVNWDIDPDSLSSAAPFAYWITGGNKNAYLHETLHFSNGQSATITASGQFSMYRPSVVMLTNNIHGTPMNVWLSTWNFFDFASIGLGVESSSNNMSYIVQVISTDFSAGLGGGSGGAKITQLCTIDAEKGAGYGLYNVPVNVSDALDGSDPYSAGTAIFKTNNPPSDRNILPLDDAPKTGGYDAFHYYGTFTDYIMFSPDGGIYVPLGKITWGTTFKAISPSSTIFENSVSGPSNPDGSYDWPVWTSTFSP